MRYLIMVAILQACGASLFQLLTGGKYMDVYYLAVILFMGVVSLHSPDKKIKKWIHYINESVLFISATISILYGLYLSMLRELTGESGVMKVEYPAEAVTPVICLVFCAILLITWYGLRERKNIDK